jgi:hypothetical protein
MTLSPLRPTDFLRVPSETTGGISTTTSSPGSRGSPPLPPDTLGSAGDDDLVVHCDEERFNEALALWNKGKEIFLASFSLDPKDHDSPSGSGGSSGPERDSPHDEPSPQVLAAVASLGKLSIPAAEGRPTDIVLAAEDDTPVDEFMTRVSSYNERPPGLEVFVSLSAVEAYNIELRKAVASHNAAHPGALVSVLEAGQSLPIRGAGPRAIPVAHTLATPLATPAALIAPRQRYYSVHPKTFDKECDRVDKNRLDTVERTIVKPGNRAEFRAKYQAPPALPPAPLPPAPLPPAPLPPAPVSCWAPLEKFWKDFVSFFEELWKRIISCFGYKSSV